jgi:hypothetical protein
MSVLVNYLKLVSAISPWRRYEVETGEVGLRTVPTIYTT